MKPGLQALRAQSALKELRVKAEHRVPQVPQASEGKQEYRDHPAPPGAVGPPGPPGPPGIATQTEAKVQMRTVTGAESVSCNETEVLVSLVCSSGAPDGTKCAPGATATGLCISK